MNFYRLQLLSIFKILILISSCYIEYGVAAWHIYFKDNKVIQSPHNQIVLKKLSLILPSYPAKNNPTLYFTFHEGKESRERWLSLIEQIPSLKDYKYEIYNTPDRDILSINIQHVSTDTCPAQIIIQDPLLPLPGTTLTVNSSGTLFLSRKADIRIRGKAHPRFLIAFYDKSNKKLRRIEYTSKIDLDSEDIQSQQIIALIETSSGVDTKQAVTIIEQHLKKESDIYTGKAMSLSAISTENMILQQHKLSEPMACFLDLKPLLPPDLTSYP